MKQHEKEELQAAIDLEAHRRQTHVSRAMTMDHPTLSEGVHALNISKNERASITYSESKRGSL